VNRRYIVIGAGAIGATIGGRLHMAGHQVVLVARGAHLAALQRDGLELVTPDGTHQLRIPAVGGPSEVQLTPDDVLILAVKSQDSDEAIRSWVDVPVGGPVGADGTARSLPMVCAQNGVANERLAARYFDHVYAMCVWLPATFLEPGIVVAEGAPQTGLLDVGRYPAGTDQVSDAVAADLTASTFSSSSLPDVMRWKYGKLLGNLNNALDALCGSADGIDELSTVLAEEGVAALDAAAIAYTTNDEHNARRADLLRVVPIPGHPRVGSSTWQSLARGTPSIETDYLNGEIALIAREHGVAVPANIALQDLARVMAREGRAPGSVPVETVWQAVKSAA
jgi:2-dehydropantoate 2-reductase